MEDGRIQVNTDALIRTLESMRSKLEENDMLTEEEDFATSVLIAHLEEME